jgi:hypothetical protein
MLTAWLRLRSMAAMLALGSLALAGCKQGIGGRCEQNSDCASGICGDGTSGGAVSAAGRQCSATLGGGGAGTSGSNMMDASEDADVGTLDGPNDAAETADASTVDACDQQSAFVYLDLPSGTDSIVSFAATGSCGQIPGGCVPVAATCQTAGCDCRITLQVNPTTIDASPNGICHIEVVPKSGSKFTTELDFGSKAGLCSAVAGTIVVASFTSDGGAG